MKRSSWIALAVCLCVTLALAGTYYISNQKPVLMTQDRVAGILDELKTAVAHRNVRKIMSYIDDAPETRISHLNHDQLRLMLARTFKQSGSLDCEYSNLNVRSDAEEATAEFDMKVNHHFSGGDAQDYNGHVYLHLHTREVSHLLGLYHLKEWRIVGAEATNIDLGAMGDY